MSPLPRMKPVLPWWQLATLLAVCAAGIYFLLPDDPRLVEKLVRDGNVREARRLLDRVPPAQRAADPARFELLELQLARRELAGDAAAGDAFWRRAALAWRATQFAEPIFTELLAATPALRDPSAAWALLAPQFDHAPAAQRTALAEAFSRVALAQGQPATAAEAFAHAHPAATGEQARELARLWQLAGRPAEALAALGDDASPAIEAQRIALLRELNRNRDVLALLRRRAEAAPQPDPALAAEIATAALAAGAPAEAVPIYRRLVASRPEDLVALRQLRQLLISAGDPHAAVEVAARAVEVGGRATEDLLELARSYEWTARPASAFDVWHELALRDQPGALERLLALNPGLFRDADLATALEHAFAKQPRDDYRLALARLHVDLGRYARARAEFEQYLATKPDAAVMLELVRLHRENFEYAPAEAWLRRVSALRPDDLALRREIAELLVYQGRHADALAAYGELLQHSDAEEIIGPFTRLAEALGRFDAFARGIARRIAASPAPAERDFVLLAYAHELAADAPGRRAALEEGLRRHPQSNDLRLQFAYLLSTDRNYKAAQQTLAAHTRLRQEPAAVALYLDLLRLNNDTAGERRFLAEPLAPAVAEDEVVLERIARAREAMRDYAEAGRLWRLLYEKHPDDVVRAGDLARLLLAQGNAAAAQRLLAPFLREPTPPVLKLASEIAEAAGDHRAAEKYQLAYLAALQAAPAADWGALGDIRLARGDRSGAKRAYAEALRRLHAEIAQRGALR